MTSFSLGRALALSALVSLVSACSGGGGGSGSDAGVSKLSPEQQQAYQAWLKAPVKSCQAIEIVGGGASAISDGFEGGPSAPTTPGFPGGGFPGFPSGSVSPARTAQNAIEKGLDLKVLAERTGGSLWLSNVSKPDFYALLSGGATAFTSGVANSKFEQTVTINGSAQSVKVETRSSGFDCVVKINDVEVAQIAIAKSVDLALAGSSALKFKDVAIPLKEAWQSYDAVTVVPVSSWMRAVDSTLRQDETATALAIGLGYSEVEAKKHFVVRGSNVGSGFGLEFASPGGKVNFAGDAEVVVDSSQARQLPESGQIKSLSIVSMYRTGGVSIGGVRFGPGSNEVMVVRRQVSISNVNANVTLQDLGNRMTAAMVPTLDMSDECVNGRLENYSTLYKVRLQARAIVELPARRLIFGACETLEPDLESRYRRSDLALLALNKLMTGVSRELAQSGPGGFSFGDWSPIAMTEIDRALELKSSSKLTRVSNAPILSELDGYISAARLTPDFQKFGAALSIGPISKLILQLSNSYRGPVVETPLVRRAVQAALKVGPVYSNSLSRALNYDSARPAVVEDVLSWVEAASSTLLQVGQEALVEAQALGYGKFQSEFESFFVLRPNERDLTIARDEMRNLKTQLAAYPALTAVKGDVVQAVYKNPKFDQKDLSVTLEATSKLVIANEDLAREFLAKLSSSSDPAEIVAARQWARAMTPADAQAIRSFLAGALSGGFAEDALSVVRSMIRTRPTSNDLAAYAGAAALSNQFLTDEKVRATGSTGDTFYESDAKTMARRIALEGFTAADVAALETLAQVAASDTFCRDRKTISYRLKCEGLDAFSKAPGKMLAPEYQGRVAKLATAIAGWMSVLKPEMDHSSVRRTLKQALFASDSGPWAKCNGGQFDLNSQALATAVQGYIQVMGDFSARFRAERAVSNAVDARCP